MAAPLVSEVRDALAGRRLLARREACRQTANCRGRAPQENLPITNAALFAVAGSNETQKTRFYRLECDCGRRLHSDDICACYAVMDAPGTVEISETFAVLMRRAQCRAHREAVDKAGRICCPFVP